MSQNEQMEGLVKRMIELGAPPSFIERWSRLLADCQFPPDEYPVPGAPVTADQVTRTGSAVTVEQSLAALESEALRPGDIRLGLGEAPEGWDRLSPYITYSKTEHASVYAAWMEKFPELVVDLGDTFQISRYAFKE